MLAEKQIIAGAEHSSARNPQLQALRDLIDKSSLFSADDAAALPVSIRSLVLLTIRSIAFFAPRPIFQPQSMLCTAGVLEHVVRDFLNECAGLQARISKYQEGLVGRRLFSYRNLYRSH